MKLTEALIKYMAFGQFKNKASSMDSYRKNIMQMILYFKDCELESIRLQDLIDYMDLMIKIGWDRNSLVGKASSFKQFFIFFQKQGIIKFDAAAIPVPNIEHKFPKIIEEGDYRKLLKAVDSYRGAQRSRAKAIVMFLWDTGVRLNEMRSLNVEDIDLVNMQCFIKTEKSRGIKPVRMAFWTKQTNEALKEYIKIRGNIIQAREGVDDGALFVNMWGRWQTGNRWSESAIESMMKYLSHKANLGYIANPHRFRHHYGRNLALKGANNSVISDLMGHSDVNSTRIYTVMNPQMMQAEYRKFNS